MIYILTYSMVMPGTPNGCVNDLFEDVFTDSRKAESAFNKLVLTQEYFRKELWVKESSGVKKLLKEERYVAQ